MMMHELGAALHAASACLPVHAGRVTCPLLGEVDIERCLECARMVRLEGRRQLNVVCDPGTAATPVAEEWEEW
jgi:hypothetical protein